MSFEYWYSVFLSFKLVNVIKWFQITKSTKQFAAGLAKKDEGQVKELEKAGVTTETTKQAMQTPAKKNARGSSNSSTDR